MLKDRARIEAIVDVAGAGKLVLEVGAGGGYSLRAYPEGGQGEPGRDLLAVGVVRADGIVAVRPGASSTVDGEPGAARRSGRDPDA